MDYQPCHQNPPPEADTPRLIKASPCFSSWTAVKPSFGVPSLGCFWKVLESSEPFRTGCGRKKPRFSRCRPRGAPQGAERGRYHKTPRTRMGSGRNRLPVFRCHPQEFGDWWIRVDRVAASEMVELHNANLPQAASTPNQTQVSPARTTWYLVI